MPKSGVIRYLTIGQVREDFPRALREVNSGDPVVVTKYGKPYAALVPMSYLRKMENNQ